MEAQPVMSTSEMAAAEFFRAERPAMVQEMPVSADVEQMADRTTGEKIKFNLFDSEDGETYAVVDKDGGHEIMPYKVFVQQYGKYQEVRDELAKYREYEEKEKAQMAEIPEDFPWGHDYTIAVTNEYKTFIKGNGRSDIFTTAQMEAVIRNYPFLQEKVNEAWKKVEEKEQTEKVDEQPAEEGGIISLKQFRERGLKLDPDVLIFTWINVDGKTMYGIEKDELQMELTENELLELTKDYPNLQERVKEVQEEAVLDRREKDKDEQERLEQEWQEIQDEENEEVLRGIRERMEKNKPGRNLHGALRELFGGAQEDQERLIETLKETGSDAESRKFQTEVNLRPKYDFDRAESSAELQEGMNEWAQEFIQLSNEQVEAKYGDDELFKLVAFKSENKKLPGSQNDYSFDFDEMQQGLMEIAPSAFVRRWHASKLAQEWIQGASSYEFFAQAIKQTEVMLPRMQEETKKAHEEMSSKLDIRKYEEIPDEEKTVESLYAATALTEKIYEKNRYDYQFMTSKTDVVPMEMQRAYEEYIAAVEHHGICTTFAYELASILQENGYEAHTLGGVKYNERGLVTGAHAFVGVNIGGEIYIFDPTAGDGGMTAEAYEKYYIIDNKREDMTEIDAYERGQTDVDEIKDRLATKPLPEEMKAKVQMMMWERIKEEKK